MNRQTRGKNTYWILSKSGLSYNNSRKTFIKPNGEECSELDYFQHTINYKFCTKKEMLNNHKYYHKCIRPSSCKNDYKAEPRRQKLKRRHK